MKLLANLWPLSMSTLLAAFRSLSGLGDPPSANSCPERLQVCGHVRVQRGHHVRPGRGRQLRPHGPFERVVHNHQYFHHFLHHWHTVPGVRAKSE